MNWASRTAPIYKFCLRRTANHWSINKHGHYTCILSTNSATLAATWKPIINPVCYPCAALTWCMRDRLPPAGRRVTCIGAFSVSAASCSLSVQWSHTRAHPCMSCVNPIPVHMYKNINMPVYSVGADTCTHKEAALQCATSSIPRRFGSEKQWYTQIWNTVPVNNAWSQQYLRTANVLSREIQFWHTILCIMDNQSFAEQCMSPHS